MRYSNQKITRKEKATHELGYCYMRLQDKCPKMCSECGTFQVNKSNPYKYINFEEYFQGNKSVGCWNK